jgi:hypothetical protein
MKPRAAIVVDRGSSPWRERFRIARVLPDVAVSRLWDDRLDDPALSAWGEQTSTQAICLLRVIDGGRDGSAPTGRRHS